MPDLPTKGALRTSAAFGTDFRTDFPEKAAVSERRSDDITLFANPKGLLAKCGSTLLLAAFAGAVAVQAGTTTVEISDVWSRPANVTAVVYATLRNRAALPDRLVGASSPVASRVELHESSQTAMPAMSSSGSMTMDDMPKTGSMVSMKPVSSIPLLALGTTSLSPGGYHLMLALRRPIKAGETIPLRLHFARAGWLAASTKVR